MKPLNGVIKTLIKINVLTASVALVSFVMVREHQATIADKRPELSNVPLTYRGAVKKEGETTSESKTERERYSAERAAQLEQEMAKLRGELTRTRQTVRDLLSRSPHDSRPTLENPPKGENRATPPYLSPVIVSLFPLLANERLQPSAPVTTKVSPVSPVDRTDRKETPVDPNDRGDAVDHGLEQQGIALLPPIDPVTRRSVDRPVTPPDGDNHRGKVDGEPVADLPDLHFGELPDISPIETDDIEKKRSIGYANDIAVGLLVADRKGQIHYGTNSYRRVQTAIRLLRYGEDIESAARRSETSMAVLQQLIKWGENRPGNLSAITEIGLANPDEE